MSPGVSLVAAHVSETVAVAVEAGLGLVPVHVSGLFKEFPKQDHTVGMLVCVHEATKKCVINVIGVSLQPRSAGAA